MALPLSSRSAKTIQTFKLTPKQLELNHLLAGPQRHTMLVGGSRSGKTFLLVRAIMMRALKVPGSRHAIVRYRFNAVRASVWLDTLPKVARLCFPFIELTDKRQDGYVLLPNGSEIWLGGLEDKERVEKILGQEYSSILFNECSQIPYSSVLIARTRLAQNVGLALRGYYDLNPVGTGHWTNRLFIQHRDPLTLAPVDGSVYGYAFINPEDNRDNLSPETLDEYRSLPDRQRRRFYEGLYQAEIDGALWTLETIEHARCTIDDVPPTLQRVVVAVDPSGTAGDEDSRSDHVGILVVGLSNDGIAYVLADLTCNLAPEGWARVAVNAFHQYKADRIVAEANYGGDMVRAVLHTIDQNVPCHLVSASRGKAVRAEPISALYGFERDGKWEKDQVRHAGEFRALEDQMLNFSTAGYLGSRSPDRCDALVWALTDLMVEPMKGWGFYELMRQRSTEVAERNKPPAEDKPNYAIGSIEYAQAMMAGKPKD